jgi:hypothetical protein
MILGQYQPIPSARKEYVASVRTQGGGTRAVTVKARNEQEARAALLRMGYREVLAIY